MAQFYLDSRDKSDSSSALSLQCLSKNNISTEASEQQFVAPGGSNSSSIYLLDGDLRGIIFSIADPVCTEHTSCRLRGYQLGSYF